MHVQVLANSWSPVMMQQWLMLLAGNAIIGLIEGAVIARVFKIKFGPTIVLMIIANYVSAVCGVLVFGIGEAPSPIPNSLFDEPLYRVGWLMWIAMAVAMAMSIIIEWPFCLAAMIGQKPLLRKSVLATLLAQASSYTCIGLSYLRGENTIGREVQVVHALNPGTSLPRGKLYYIADDGDVWTMRLDGSALTRAFDTELHDSRDVLCAWREPDEDGQPWRLLANARSGTTPLLDNLPGRVEGFRMDPYTLVGAPLRQHKWLLGFSGIADFRAVDQRDWRVNPRGNGGIAVSNVTTGASYDITYDTAFTSWWGSSVHVLPGNLAIFELAEQVCLLDIPRRQLTLLVRGRGPVVVLDPQPTPLIMQPVSQPQAQ